MAAALETVVKQLEDSGIVAPGKLENFVPPKAHPTSVEALVAELAKNNHLTKFQATQVAAGKAKSLILGGYTMLSWYLASSSRSTGCRNSTFATEAPDATVEQTGDDDGKAKSAEELKRRQRHLNSRRLISQARRRCGRHRRAAPAWT